MWLGNVFDNKWKVTVVEELADFLFKKIVDYQSDKTVKKKRPMLMCGIYFSSRILNEWIGEFNAKMAKQNKENFRNKDQSR
mgnify:CR=1 FL=1